MHTKLIAIVIATLLGFGVTAHEQTPAYPKMIKYFRIALYDQNFEGLPFSAKYRIMKVDYQTRKNFNVYIRKQDLGRAMYICTISKVAKGISSKPFVQSMVCSKIKEETK